MALGVTAAGSVLTLTGAMVTGDTGTMVVSMAVLSAGSCAGTSVDSCADAAATKPRRTVLDCIAPTVFENSFYQTEVLLCTWWLLRWGYGRREMRNECRERQMSD